MKTRLFGGASPFAHLAGIGLGASRRSAEDDDDNKEGKRSRRASDDEDDEPKGRRGSRASDDEDEDDEPKGKRSRRAEEDDDDDKAEMNGRSAAASARRRERERCASIFMHPAAAGNVALAASLAFETTMTRKEAIAVLKGQAGRGDDREDGGFRSDRRSRNPDIAPGGEPVRGAQAAASSWDAAFNKAGVTPKK